MAGDGRCHCKTRSRFESSRVPESLKTFVDIGYGARFVETNIRKSVLLMVLVVPYRWGLRLNLTQLSRVLFVTWGVPL